MHFGLVMECEVRAGRSQTEAFEDVFELAGHAERQGLDGVWLAEHHFAPPRADISSFGGSVVSSPLILATAIALRVERIRVGTAVLVLPLGHPMRMAEEAATVDHLTHGRLDLGIGRSGFPHAYAGYDVPFEKSRAMFLEYLEVMLKAWGDQPFSYEGEFYRVDEVSVSPRPYQQPHPPLRAAATNPETFALMGNLGLPIFAGLRGLTLAQLAPAIDDYRAAWRAAGHAGDGDIFLRIPVYVHPDAELARAEPEGSTRRAYARLGRAFADSTQAGGEGSVRTREAVADALVGVDYDSLLRDRLAYGTPDQVTRRLDDLRNHLGLSGFVIEPNSGGQIPHPQILASIALFAQEVMPALR